MSMYSNYIDDNQEGHKLGEQQYSQATLTNQKN